MLSQDMLRERVSAYTDQVWHHPDHQDTPRVQVIVDEMMAHDMNRDFTSQGIKPLLSIHPQARIVLIGQAPGHFAQDTLTPWNDPSGDRLREWLGVDMETFYTSDRIAIMNMDAYFPGVGKSGDLPPRKEFAQLWHPRLLECMPKAELFVTIGGYSTKRYLNLKSSERLTDVVRNFAQYGPRYFPLVHPSGRNNIWQAKNPWFEREVIPQLQQRVRQLI
ncbi:uracil-DNA glycosylase family protein [Alloscardovia venturai]|uniref:Uracil-DNA glycosylase family protein n=1 Tax=Alloscardovia venturai TaxID=1769421 RepID=A0ABW2Y545_9BIFI